MAETGKVRLAVGKNFGFIKAADGTDVFVHPSSYPAKMSVLDGDEISYDIDLAGPKGPRAVNVTMISRGTAKPTPTPTMVTAPPTTPSPPQSIEVAWNPGSPTKQGRSNVLPLTLTLSGALRTSNVEILLKANGKQMKSPSPNPSPDAKGNVTFLIPLAVALLYAFVAEVKVDGKVLKNITYTWEWRKTKTSKAAPAPAPAATEAELKLPEIEVVNPPRDLDQITGMFIVNLVTRKDGKKADRDFSAICGQAITIMQSSPTGLTAVTTFTSIAAGQYQLHVNFAGLMVKIVFKLDNGKEVAVWLTK